MPADKRTRPKAIDFFSGSDGGTEPTACLDRDNESSSDSDAPRVAQWIDDDELDRLDSEDDGERSASEAEPSHRLQSLQDDLSALPLGTLRSAQRSLARAQALTDTDSEDESSPSEDGNTSPRPAKGDDDKEKRASKSKNVTTKRTNKHAPVEMTSKRPVSRRRVVVDDALPKPRDPRFMHAVGRYDPSKFKQQYDFLTGLRNDELVMLRENVKRARKLATNSPSHLRTEREEEVNRLELALKRAESAVNLDNRERIESKTLQSAKRTEIEKRKQGKAGWWMKQSEKKSLLTKARLDAIASVGGKQAVKRAIERKQRKISQKEKKTRPFSRTEKAESSEKSRPASAGRSAKRRRV